MTEPRKIPLLILSFWESDIISSHGDSINVGEILRTLLTVCKSTWSPIIFKSVDLLKLRLKPEGERPRYPPSAER